MHPKGEPLPRIFEGRWAISRKLKDILVALVEGYKIFDEEYPTLVLEALKIPVNDANLDIYFPRNKAHERCPTFELMDRFFQLSQVQGPTVGV